MLKRLTINLTILAAMALAMAVPSPAEARQERCKFNCAWRYVGCVEGCRIGLCEIFGECDEDEGTPLGQCLDRCESRYGDCINKCESGCDDVTMASYCWPVNHAPGSPGCTLNAAEDDWVPYPTSSNDCFADVDYEYWRDATGLNPPGPDAQPAFMAEMCDNGGDFALYEQGWTPSSGFFEYSYEWTQTDCP